MRNEMKWQPIETAPKDGTDILIVTSRFQIVNVARWSEECDVGGFSTGPGWQVFECEDGWYSIGFTQDEVSHWMPLPEPPEDE